MDPNKDLMRVWAERYLGRVLLSGGGTQFEHFPDGRPRWTDDEIRATGRSFHPALEELIAKLTEEYRGRTPRGFPDEPVFGSGR